MRPTAPSTPTVVRRAPQRGVTKATKPGTRRVHVAKVAATTKARRDERAKKKAKGAGAYSTKRKPQSKFEAALKAKQVSKVKSSGTNANETTEGSDTDDELKAATIIDENVKKKMAKTRKINSRPRIKRKVSTKIKKNSSSPSRSEKKKASVVSDNDTKNTSPTRKKTASSPTRIAKPQIATTKNSDVPKSTTAFDKIEVYPDTKSTAKSKIIKTKKAVVSKVATEKSDIPCADITKTSTKSLSEDQSSIVDNAEFKVIKVPQATTIDSFTKIIALQTCKPFSTASNMEDKESPFARKQVIAKVKPIARVKGTVVSNVRLDIEKKNTLNSNIECISPSKDNKRDDQNENITETVKDAKIDDSIQSLPKAGLLDLDEKKPTDHLSSSQAVTNLPIKDKVKAKAVKTKSSKLKKPDTSLIQNVTLKISPKSTNNLIRKNTNLSKGITIFKKAMGKCTMLTKPKVNRSIPPMLPEKRVVSPKSSRKTDTKGKDDEFENCTFSINEDKLPEQKKKISCKTKSEPASNLQSKEILSPFSSDSEVIDFKSIDVDSNAKDSLSETIPSNKGNKFCLAAIKSKLVGAKALKTVKNSVKNNSEKCGKNKAKVKIPTVTPLEDPNPTKKRLKLLGFWTGPKRHRVASLNALAKVQCLYENENRTHMELGLMRTVERSIPSKPREPSKKKITEKKEVISSSESEYERKVKREINSSSEDEPSSPPVAMTLRRQPGGRSDGKYWDPKSSTSSSEDSENEIRKVLEKKKALLRASCADADKASTSVEGGAPKAKNLPPVKRRRKRAEVVMDLRDMVVRKRMASLNATAILAASYEKRSPKSGSNDSTSDSFSSDRDSFVHKKKPKASQVKCEGDSPKNAEARGGGCSKRKVEVIVNQDTDVTITGVYSAHHAGFCTTQYRISSTSHTHTTATTSTDPDVVPGTSSGGPASGSGLASYAPLVALSSMQPPPDQHHPHQKELLGGLDRRSGRPSAFSAPSPHHSSGYYQPAGPLIKEARDDMGGGYGAGAASGPPPQPFQPPYHAAPQQQPQPQPQHQLVHAVAGYGVGQYFPPELCFSRYYGRPPAYPPPPPQPQAPPQVPQDPQMMSPYYPAHCYHQSPPHRPMPYIPEAFRGGPAGGPPCPCPMRTCPKNVITGPAVGASGSAEEAGAAGGKASPAPALAPLAPAVKREAEPPPREVSFSPKKAGVAPDEPVDLKVENVSDADASPLHRPQSPLKSTPLPEPSLPQITPILQTLLPPNGISEHVKLQKRQKLIDKSQLETVKVPKLTDKVRGIKKKKSLSPLKPKTAVKKTTVIPVELTTTTLDITNEVVKNTSNLTKIDLPPTTETSCQINISPTKNGFDVMKHSTEVKQLTVPPAVSLPLPSIESAKKAINKRKNGLSEPILESVAKKKKLTDANERNPELKLALARPKNKSALLLDKLIKKNSIDRVIESVVKEASMDRCDLLNKTSARRKSAEGKRRKSISSDKCMKTPPVGIPMEIAKKGRKGIKSTSPKWSNGWSWQGEPYYAKVYINSAGTWGVRTCWPSMWHAGGAAGVRRGDAVLLRASSRGAAPFVARVAHLWRDHDGEMMLSLVWYYRPEHTERGRQDDDAPDEVFASRHRDSNSVACIDDKCYVLTYNEYCRYRKLVRASEQGITLGRSIVPPIPRMQTHPASSVRYPRLLPPLDISSDRVLFCRKVYDYRLKKIIKTPPC